MRFLTLALSALLLASCTGNGSAEKKAEAAKGGLSEEEINALFEGQAVPQEDTLSYDTAYELEPLGD